MNLSEFYSQILGIEMPWQISKVEVSSSSKDVRIEIALPKDSKIACPCCGQICSIYDYTPERQWRHLDTCDHETHIHSRIPRTQCDKCGIHRVLAAWTRPYSKFTLLFERHAIEVLQNNQVLSRSAQQLNISLDEMRGIRDKALERGLNRRQADKPTYKVVHLCIDEKSLFRGHHYVTIFYDGQTGRVLEVIEHRTQIATQEGLRLLDKLIKLSDVEVVTMDMWEAFRNAVELGIPQADIVHDRFHIAQHLNKAVDIVRRAENKKLGKQEDERLKKTRYIWLKDPEKLTDKQQVIFDELVQDHTLNTVKSWELKENFKSFFDCQNKAQALQFFKDWKKKVEDNSLKPLLKVADMIKKHLDRMLNYFKHRVSNAMAECKNASIQQIKMKARGFKSAKAFRNAILFYCGQLELFP
ncbi:MAG: ISL3 family transposase [Bacteroidota bacterium]